MRFHYNTQPEETVAYLRDQAIRAKQPPAVIDALDDLRDLLEAPDEIEKLENQVNELEADRDNLREELEQLTEQTQLAWDILASINKNRAGAGPATFYDAADLDAIARQLDIAKKALERHKA